MDFLASPLGDGLLKLLITVAILVAAWVLVRAVLKLAGRLAALGCLAILIVGIVAAILVIRGG